MQKSKNIIATTSNMIDGAKIISYGGIISSHVVAGTNIFSDIFASFSDFFGGRSGSYQKQIESVKEEAIYKLKLKAKALGCNGIISVSLDVDEISGKNVSMFMITAYGTAVDLEIQQVEDRKTKPDVIDGEEIEKALKRKYLAQKYANNPLFHDTAQDEWRSALALSIPQLIPSIIDYFRSKHAFRSYDDAERLTEYVSSINISKATSLLYTLASDIEGSNYNEFANIIIKCGLQDYSATLQMLESDEPMVRKAALDILITYKRTYGESDILLMQQNIDKISSVFPDVSESYTKKGLVGGEKSLWKCALGHEGNNSEHTHCKECRCDRRGFSPTETKPETAQKHLKDIIATLKDYLNNDSADR
ncbi:YbjQ family protein [Alteromonas sp. 1_MG-2023]|uniref:YbjQ family protein n=1 Tax=Alteromonas sp. 1_MG-2023 TaxID=3062669 RepID=UPI0026E3664F|nr:YbjQ family protein [Alteromonas sp. 1_MG-2023]MDO6475735.1 YbjQ family protein [Alteromonas sp. 1_MG-2023]